MRHHAHPLPDSASDEARGRVLVTLTFDRGGLSMTRTPFGTVVRLADLKSGGEPGAPALPRTQVRIAVPPASWPHELEVVDEQWETVVDGGAVVVPAQPLRAGLPSPRSGGAKSGGARSGETKKAAGKKGAARKAAKKGSAAAGRRTRTVTDLQVDDATAQHDGGVHCAADCSCRRPLDVFRPPLTEGFPPPAFVPPDPERYAAAAADPPPVARAARLETIGTTRVAVVELAPVRLTRKGGLELCTSLTLAVRYEDGAPLGDHEKAVASFREQLGRDVDPSRVVPMPDRPVSGAAEAARLQDIARDSVLNGRLVGPVDRHWPIVDLPSEYLVVTDDVRWDAATITPGAAVPGMVEQFERLAAAKRARGISARVVTISDVVAGRYGDVRTGSRDLQEVLRRFLKLARERWGVCWLLLGGDVSVVPVRSVAGAMLGRVDRDSKADPDDDKSFWTGSYLKMKVVNPGVWWSASAGNLLVRSDTGDLIPYDAAGTASPSSPGWYFTAADWSTRSAMATQYVRVEGPAALVDGDMLFLYQWNTLPTDLYYASLAAWVVGYQTVDVGWMSFQLPYVYLPEHDWDALDNGVYGQHRADGTDLDGVHLATDLSVGRAPVESATEAATFVDKVLAYERAGGGFWQTADAEWPTRVVLASSDWGGRSWFQPTNDTVPADGRYHHDAAAMRSLLKKDAAPDGFAYELIAHVTDTDRRVLPYKTSTSSAVRGWYFARSATDTSINEVEVNFGWITIRLPMPSPWIVVHGPLAERTPAAYELDPTDQDGSMSDQESLRSQILSELPQINDFQRLYEDEIDLTLAERFAAPVEYLTSGRLQTALNTRPHFMSLSGHGNSDGCCGGSVGLAQALTNGQPGFIGYADSCLTNQFDHDDAFSEALVTNPDGGAVGYVGNTRFSWIGVGDNFQRAFFHRLTTTRHLGLLNDSRLGVYGTTGAWTGYDRWAIFTLNLLGDPELRVYRSVLPRLRIRISDPLDRIIQVEPRLAPLRPSRPVPDPPPLEGIRVHVVSGDRTFEGITDDAGRVPVPADLVTGAPWEVTVSHPDFVTAYEVLDAPAPPGSGGSGCGCGCGCRCDDRGCSGCSCHDGEATAT